VSGPARRRLVVWQKEDGYGVELGEVALYEDRLSAQGVAIGWQPVPYRLELDLETGAAWVTRRLAVRVRGDGWMRSIDLRRSEAGSWTVHAETDGDVDLEPAGGDPAALEGAVDCDLGLSPLTNTMPVLRHDLLDRDGSQDLLMAWVSVPALALYPMRQRYASVADLGDGRRRIEYRSLESDFTSQLTFDADGLVFDYPMLARRVG